MVLPLTVLKLTTKQPVLVECKSGETLNGTLVRCDAWMNLHLRDVTVTSSTGEAFFQCPECLIKGSAIKYVRLGDDVMQQAIDSNRRHAAKLERERQQGDHGSGNIGRDSRSSPFRQSQQQQQQRYYPKKDYSPHKSREKQ